MANKWNTIYIDPEDLLSICRGDRDKMNKYLNQFLELIPPRIESLKASVCKEDRKATRQILHQMSPQLQFFGIPGIETPIQRLELEYLTLPMADLKALVNDILTKLAGACKEVQLVLKTNFD